MKETQIDQVCQKLSHLLGDTQVLYVKTLNFHWNMHSPQFFMYHKLLQTHYEDLQEVGDELAERIRMLQRSAPGSMAEFLKLACLKESANNLSGQQMIEELVANREHMVKHYLEVIQYTDSIGDQGSSDMLVSQLRDHDKQAWLLRSHLTS